MHGGDNKRGRRGTDVGKSSLFGLNLRKQHLCSKSALNSYHIVLATINPRGFSP